RLHAQDHRCVCWRCTFATHLLPRCDEKGRRFAMRLRWLIAIPAIYIAVAVISGIIWGFSATFSLGVGAGAFVIAAIFMLWARFGRQPSVRSASEDEPFAGYPEGHVLAAVPTGAVDSLESDLRAAGFREHDVLSGLSGEA